MVSKLKTAIVLVIIGALSGFLIWGVNELSKDGILENREIREQGYYKEIFNLDENTIISFTKTENYGLEEVVLLDSSDEVIGYIYKMSDTNAYGNTIVLVGIDLEGVIQNVIISSSTNTPNYVKKVRDDNLSGLSNQNVSDVEYDDTTAATFTYTSVKKVVDASVKYFLENRVNREEDHYKEIFSLDENAIISFTKTENDGLEEVVLLDSSDEVIGYIYKMSDTNIFGDIIVLVGIDLEGVIQKVIISSSNNIPAYVQSVREGNLSGLSNQSVSDVEYDDTTSATFTYTSVKKVVDASVEYYLENRGDE